MKIPFKIAGQRSKLCFHLLCTLFCLSLTMGAQAQEDIDDLFEDGTDVSKKNFILFNVSALLQGEASVQFVRGIAKTVNLELGAGYQLPYYVAEIPNISGYAFPNIKPNSGYNYTVGFSYNPYKTAPFGLSIGPKLRTHVYNFDDEQITQRDIGAYVTADYNFKKRFIFQYEVGFGGMLNTVPEKYWDIETRFIFPIILKFGYAF